MPKVELGTCGVVAGEELKIENKNLPVGGAFCVLGVLWGVIADVGSYCRYRLLSLVSALTYQ
jgi:hypothetical protein